MRAVVESVQTVATVGKIQDVAASSGTDRDAAGNEPAKATVPDDNAGVSSGPERPGHHHDLSAENGCCCDCVVVPSVRGGDDDHAFPRPGTGGVCSANDYGYACVDAPDDRAATGKRKRTVLLETVDYDCDCGVAKSDHDQTNVVG